MLGRAIEPLKGLTPRSGARLGLALASLYTLTGTEAQTLLAWADEFSQADGSSPDPSKWGHNIGGGGGGNNELQHYTRRTNNARIEGGQLVIEALEESHGKRDYASAQLLTKHKSDWTYGHTEARIKIPR